jgi:uncharacterized protein (TIGR02145 family)
MKTRINNSKEILLIVIISLICLSFSANAQLLHNGDFESGTNNNPALWYPNAWLNNGTVFKWENGTGIDGSRCISIENIESNDARWAQKIKLKGYTTYEFSGYIRGENIQNNQSDDIYTNLSVLELWDYGQVKKTTFGWTKVTCRFTTDKEGYYTLCARNGYYWNVTTGKCWFDNLSLKEIEKPRLDTIKGNQIVLYLKESDLTNITESNMTRWIEHLDSAILKYEELIGQGPNTGYPLTVLSVDKYPGGWAVAGNPIKWYQIYIGRELKVINDHDDWSFGILHEIGHNFDYPYWNFHGEHFANFKMFYVIQALNGRFWRDGSHIVGHDYKDYYKGVYNRVKQHYKSTGEIMHLYGDALTYKFIDIADSIGWEPFRETFRAYLANPSIAQPGNINKYFHFLDMLSRKSGKDVRQYLTWDDRNEFVLYLGSMKYPYPPSDLKMKARDCEKAMLEWKDQSGNETGFILEKRTENTWYSGEVLLEPDCTSYCDSEISSDSTYYYRIRSYNNYGKSDFSVELKTDKLPQPETPWFSHHHFSFKTGDTLHFKWTADTINNDSVLWSFMLDNPDLTGDTIFFIKTSLDFNRQLKTEFEINNRMDSTRCFMALNLDLDPGNWDIDIDSLYLNKPLSPTIFQWIPMYDLAVPTWEIKVENTVEIFREGFEIDVIFSKQFCGYVEAIIRGTNECGTLGLKETVHVDVIPEVFQPSLSHHYLEVCEGEELPEIIARGENIRWYSDSANPLYDFRDEQIYDVVTIGGNTWMNENLNVFTPSGSFYPKQDSLTYHPYGRMYSWELAENICPRGWQIADRYKWQDLLDSIGIDTKAYNYHFIPPGYDPILFSFYYWVPYYGFGTAPEGFVFIKVDENNIMQESFFSKPDAVDVSQIPGFYIRCTKDKYRPVYEGNKLPIKRLETGKYIFYVSQSISGHEGVKDTLIIKVNPIPDPPLTANYEICKNDDLPEMEVAGNNIRWYSDYDLTNQRNNGNSYCPKVIKPDTTRYFVTQTMLNCESIPDTLLLIIHQCPYFSLGKDTTITSDQKLIIGTEQAGCDYLWSDGSFGANLEIAGEEIGVGEHTYWLTITNQFGCYSSDSITISVIQATNTANAVNRGMTVHPNPAHDFITIMFEREFNGRVMIRLLDCTGNTVYLNEKVHLPLNKRADIDVSSLPKGIYVLKIKCQGYTIIEKILVY